jgi:hypothetical protein
MPWVIVTDYGSVRVPEAVGAALEVVPRRVDGMPDRRFKAARLSIEWSRDVNRAMKEFFMAGGDAKDFCAFPQVTWETGL